MVGADYESGQVLIGAPLAGMRRRCSGAEASLPPRLKLASRPSRGRKRGHAPSRG